MDCVFTVSWCSFTERTICSPNGLFAYRTNHLLTEWPLRLPNEPLAHRMASSPTERAIAHRMASSPTERAIAHQMASSPTERATCSPNGLFAYRTSHCSPNGLFAYRTSHLAHRMASSPAICSPNGLFAYRTSHLLTEWPLRLPKGPLAHRISPLRKPNRPLAHRMTSLATERTTCSPNSPTSRSRECRYGASVQQGASGDIVQCCSLWWCNCC